MVHGGYVDEVYSKDLSFRNLLIRGVPVVVKISDNLLVRAAEQQSASQEKP
jgi:hypothetical protein